MANQLSRTDSSSNQDIRQRFNVKKTIIGVIVLLIGLFHLPEAILLTAGTQKFSIVGAVTLSAWHIPT